MLWEYVLATEHTTLHYNLDGTCAYGEMNGNLPAPTKLKWDFSNELQQIISDCYKSAQLLVADVDLKLVGFNTYGKGFMKKCRSFFFHLSFHHQLILSIFFLFFSLKFRQSITRCLSTTCFTTCLLS